MSLHSAEEEKVFLPGKGRLFLRTFLPWQILRFLLINLKMTQMIIKSHGSENKKSDS